MPKRKPDAYKVIYKHTGVFTYVASLDSDAVYKLQREGIEYNVIGLFEEPY